jgi:Protein of unknown function (DUF3298)/Deacetylase PdaC
MNRCAKLFIEPKCRRTIGLIAMAALIFDLTGCQQSAAALSDDPATTVMKPAIRKPDGTPLVPVVPKGATGEDKGYRYRINYPALQSDWRALDDAMHAYGEAQKKSFFTDLAKRPPIKPNEGLALQTTWDLQIDLTVATETQAFVSVLANGSVFTGGAHPNPIVASFSEHVPSGKIVAIGDLFTNADAGIKLLSAETRRQLKAQFDAKLRAQNTDPKILSEQLKNSAAMIDQGTQSTPDNFSAFLVDGAGGKAIGLTIVFAPYQVAPYVDGAQQIEVPARIFYMQLKSDYRDAFAIDPEDLKRLNAGQ